ncbi:hypothetical protein K2173_013480 [Erythroxylum novogranatense]|uniref:DUF4283 domain-containing protein n=1 Tax=Erythroxylum novogranatense TaxID=1862640 RepID=A0AAV8S9Y0_9ROSI|nr:hypothetical protein K2173_013480 [Erythroxylum novogranatense]
MAEDMASLSVDDDGEEEVVVIDGDVGEESDDSTLCVVGHFLTERSVNFTTMKHTLVALMKPIMGMSVREVNGGVYLFQFYHKALLMEKMGDYDHACDVPLNHPYLWVKVFGLRAGFKSESVLKQVGDAIGEFVEVDSNNCVQKWCEFWQVRIKFDIRKPIKDSMKLKKGDSNERIPPTFCFLCGIISHGEKFCSLLVHANGAPVPRKFGPHLRDDNRRRHSFIGSKWLREEPSFVDGIGEGMIREDGGTSTGRPRFHGVNPQFSWDLGRDKGVMEGISSGNLNMKDPGNIVENKAVNVEGEIRPKIVTISDPKRR